MNTGALAADELNTEEDLNDDEDDDRDIGDLENGIHSANYLERNNFSFRNSNLPQGGYRIAGNTSPSSDEIDDEVEEEKVNLA